MMKAYFTLRSLVELLQVKYKSKVKGSGQECPLHTGGAAAKRKSRFLRALPLPTEGEAWSE